MVEMVALLPITVIELVLQRLELVGAVLERKKEIPLVQAVEVAQETVMHLLEPLRVMTQLLIQVLEVEVVLMETLVVLVVQE